MPFSSSNTGNTDLRDTEVQQPNTAAHLSTDSNCRAFSAKSGQFEAGSTTTGSSFRPSSPPFLFCAAISISMMSFSVVSLIAIVPDSECSTPTLMVPPLGEAAGALVWACAFEATAPLPLMAARVAAAPKRPRSRRDNFDLMSDMRLSPSRRNDAACQERISNSRARKPQAQFLIGIGRSAAIGGTRPVWLPIS